MNLSAVMKPMPRVLRRHRLVRLVLFLSPSSAIQEVEFNGGARLYADVSDEFARVHFLTGTFEPEFFDIAAPFLVKGGVFFDVGAQFGFCTFGLVHRLNDVALECHLFEASPAMCGLLARSKRLYPLRNIDIHQVCVAERAGSSPFKIVSHHLGASHVSADGQLSVSNLVLDDYIAKRGIHRIDFMKIDVEGCELRALHGLAGTLTEKLVSALYFEACCETLQRHSAGVVDLLDFLSVHGYRTFYVKPEDLHNGSHPGSIRVNGFTMPVKEVNNDFPEGHLTDLLSLPRDSEFLQGAAL